MADRTPIRASLVSRSTLLPLVMDGLQAVKAQHREFIDAAIRPRFADSLDIDEAFRRGRETEHRWDYLLGDRQSGKILGLEPHNAANKEVTTVIKKREQSLAHLRGHLKDGVFIADWFWVASGKVDFTPMDKAINRLADNGIKFVGKRLLVKEMDAHTATTKAKRRK